MYVCGPTVYDTPHIGNGRTAVVFDTIRRYLEWSGLDVTYVSNVTDVEDKIIARAAARGPDRARGRDASSRRLLRRSMARLGVRDGRPPSARRPTTSTACWISSASSSPRGHAYVVDGPGRLLRRSRRSPATAHFPHRTLEELRESAGRSGRRRRGEAQPDGLRALEGGQAGRARVGLAVGPRPPGLAHRVLGDVTGPAR